MKLSGSVRRFGGKQVLLAMGIVLLLLVGGGLVVPAISDAMTGPKPSDDPVKAQWQQTVAVNFFEEEMAWSDQQQVCMWFHQEPEEALDEITTIMLTNGVPAYRDALEEYLQGLCS